MQVVIVAALVATSFVYAAWVLMPAAWRRPLARGLIGRVPAIAAWPALQRAARSQGGGCGCSDCPATPPAAGGEQRVSIVRRH